MPLHDYRCPDCGLLWPDVYKSVAEGASANPPACPNHPTALIVMDWIPQARFDMKSDGGTNQSFQKFEVSRQVVELVDGQPQLVNKTETIDSVSKLRKIEADSEQRFRNGEGEPMRFRMWNQNRSNKDQNSFGDAGQIGGEAYDSGTPLKRSGRVSLTKHGTEKPTIPVARGGGVTALKG